LKPEFVRSWDVHCLPFSCSAQAADASGSSDPYVVITLDERKEKTDVKKETLDPEWYKEFDFPLDKPPKSGSCCIYGPRALAGVPPSAPTRRLDDRNAAAVRSV
jgi:hypothetical protein